MKEVEVKQNHCLIIGNSDYLDQKSFPTIRFAQNDVRKLYSLLTSFPTGIFSSATSLLKSNIKRDEFNDILDVFFASVKREDLVFIYFAGHARIMPGNKRLFLAMSDSYADHLARTAFDVDGFLPFFEEKNLSRYVVVLDCCRAGTALRSPGVKHRGMLGNVGLASSFSRGKVIVASTMDYQLAHELQSLKHGVFSYYFIRGIETGEATATNMEVISVSDLVHYVQEQLEQYHPDISQQPDMSGTGMWGKLIIARNPKYRREMIQDPNAREDYPISSKEPVETFGSGDDLLCNHESYMFQSSCVNDIDLLPLASYVLLTSEDGVVRVWSREANSTVTCLEHDCPTRHGRYFRDKGHIVVGTPHGVRLWSLPETKELLLVNYSHLQALAISGDGRSIALGGGGLEGTASCYYDSSLIKKFTGYHRHKITSVSINHDGSLLAAASFDRQVLIWRVTDGFLVRAFQCATSIAQVAFSPKQSIIVAALKNGTILFWELARGIAFIEFEAPGSSANGLCFAPNGEVLAVFSNHYISLWSTTRGVLLQVVKTEERFSCLRFSSDGQTLAAGTVDGSLHLWAIRKEALHEFEVRPV